MTHTAPVSDRSHGPAGCSGTGDAFDALLRSFTEELRVMGERQLRLADIDARLVRLYEMEDQGLISEEQYQRMDVPARRTVDAFASALVHQRSVLRDAYEDPVVVADVFAVLEESWRRANPARICPRGEVLVVVGRLQANHQLAITAPFLAARPRAGGHRSILLRCEEWYFEMVTALGARHVGPPLRGISPEERDAVTVLWDEDPASEFHRLDTVLDTVKRIG